MVLSQLQRFMARFEELVEDSVLILLSIFVIILLAVSLVIMATQPSGIPVDDRTAQIATIMQIGFLAKAELLAGMMLPWMLIIIGLLGVRELWMVRRRLEGIHFEAILYRMRGTPAGRSVRVRAVRAGRRRGRRRRRR